MDLGQEWQKKVVGRQLRVEEQKEEKRYLLKSIFQND